MNHFIGELLGTFILVLLGDGVVGGNVLKGTKEEGTGWNAIAIGWGIAVAVAIYAVSPLTPAHLNPAVTLAMASIGKLVWSEVPVFIAGQFIGAMLAACALWIHYHPHFKETSDQGAILGTFATAPAVRHTPSNFFGEALGTAVLMIAILSIDPNKVGAGFAPIIVGFAITAVGYSLGGTTGFAINPARDLGPRVMHALLPIPNKGGSDWSYSWIPVVAPIVGAVLATFAYNAILG